MNSFSARIFLANALYVRMLDYKASTNGLKPANKPNWHLPGTDYTRIEQGSAAPGLETLEKIDPEDIRGAQCAKVADKHIGRAHAGKWFEGLILIAARRSLGLLLSNLDACLRGFLVDESFRKLSIQS